MNIYWAYKRGLLLQYSEWADVYSFCVYIASFDFNQHSLCFQINKLGEELRVQGMEDHFHVEWSSSTISVITSLLLTLSKAKLSAPRRISNAAMRPVRSMNMNIPMSQENRNNNLALLLKFDVTNTNVFLCNNYNGKSRQF